MTFYEKTLEVPWWMLCLGRSRGRNPRGLRPLGFWPWDLPRHNIHHGTSSAFSNNVPGFIRGWLCSVVSHKSYFGNQEIRQLEPWNLAQWEILSLVPGEILWRMCIGGLGAKKNQLINRHLCEITRGPPSLPTFCRHSADFKVDKDRLGSRYTLTSIFFVCVYFDN